MTTTERHLCLMTDLKPGISLKCHICHKPIKKNNLYTGIVGDNGTVWGRYHMECAISVLQKAGDKAIA